MFYTKLKQLCEEKNIVISNMLEEIGLSPSLATTWKQKGTKPKIENIRKIAKYLEVPEEYFTEDSEKITNSNSIIGNQNAGDNTITVTHQENSAIDEMEKELLIRFRKLKIDNKIKSFNFISELAKQESNR